MQVQSLVRGNKILHAMQEGQKKKGSLPIYKLEKGVSLPPTK